MNRKELIEYYSKLGLFEHKNIIKAVDSISDEKLNMANVSEKILELSNIKFKNILRDKNAQKNRVLVICSILFLIITIIFLFKK